MDYQLCIRSGWYTYQFERSIRAYHQGSDTNTGTGKKVVLASGRPTRGVVPLAEKLHLKDYGSYILSFNGGRITDCRTGQVIYNKTIPDDVALPLFHIAKKYAGADILAYTEDTILSGIRPNQYTELESRINHMQIIQGKRFSERNHGAFQ